MLLSPKFFVSGSGKIKFLLRNKMAEKINTSLSKDQVVSWVELVRSDNPGYRQEIGKALEAGDPVAREFIRQAQRVDPEFVQEYYPGYVPKANDQPQERSAAIPLLAGLFSRLRVRAEGQDLP